MKPDEFFQLYPIKDITRLIEFIDWHLRYGVGISIDNEPSEAQISVRLSFDESIIGLSHGDEEDLLETLKTHYKELGWNGVRTRRIVNNSHPARTKIVFVLTKFTQFNPDHR